MNIYRVTISDDDPLCGLLAISLVDFPAVEKNFLKFKQDGQQPKRNNLKADEEQRIITGIALLADTPIYRYDPDFGARPVKRAIQHYVLNDLSKRLLAGEVTQERPIIVDEFGEGLVFRN